MTDSSPRSHEGSTPEPAGGPPPTPPQPGPPKVVVLLPTATIEDFPTRLSTADARALLASVTVSYDPRLVAAAGSSPSFCRSDLPTTPETGMLFLASSIAAAKLPDNFRHRLTDAGARLIEAEDRGDFLSQLELGGAATQAEQSEQAEHPIAASGPASISELDFYAAGYTRLQVQIMTQRLRYTSNVDDIQLEQWIVQAADAFVKDDFQAAAEILHQVFDALGEERDHYFTSDPHLIDLTLTTARTLPGLLDHWRTEPPHPSTSVLVDADCLTQASPSIDSPVDSPTTSAPPPELGQSLAEFRQYIDRGQISLAGGGPPASDSLASMTLTTAIDRIAATRQQFADQLGSPPPVYARLAGQTPGDLVPAIAAAGYAAIIPIDFTSGRPISDQSKVRLPVVDADIEALVSTPIDAADDTEFLDLGPRLATAIDAGDVATALLAHWPGIVCDSMRDVLRSARWGRALGRFWSIDDYFQTGQKPYHDGKLEIVDGDPSLEPLLDSPDDAIGQHARRFADQVVTQYRQLARSIVSLTNKAVGGDDKPGVENVNDFGEPIDDVTTAVAAAVGAIPSAGGDAKLLFHPGPAGRRITTMLQPAGGTPPSKDKTIFAASQASQANQTNQSDQANQADQRGRSGRRFDLTADVPSGGFVVLRGGDGSSLKSNSLVSLLMGQSKAAIVRGSERIRLENEFLEASIAPAGGVAGIFSGASRGNRLSAKLVIVTDRGTDSVMHSKTLQTIHNSAAAGVVAQSGRLTAPDENHLEVADYQLQYSLERGSRHLKISGNVRLLDAFELGGRQGWKNYVALRVAMPDQSASVRYGVRDKWHLASTRRVTAPYGYLVNDVDRHTLVATGGHGLHRRVGDRFIDTLLMVGKNRTASFEFSIVCDPPHPMASAIESITPPIELPILTHQSLPNSGYLCHLSGRDVLIRNIHVARQPDGLRWRVDVVATRAKSSTATLHFCRELKSVRTAAGAVIEHQSDTVTVPLAGHQQESLVIDFA